MNLLRAFNTNPAPTEAHIAVVLVAVLSVVAFQAWALGKGQDFNARDFGEALGYLIGGGGLAAFGQGYLTRARGHLAGGNVRPANPDA